MRYLVFILFFSFHVSASTTPHPHEITSDIPLYQQTCRGRCISEGLRDVVFTFCRRWENSIEKGREPWTANLKTTKRQYTEDSLLQYIEDVNTKFLTPAQFSYAAFNIYHFLQPISTCVWAADLKCLLIVIGTGQRKLLTHRKNNPYAQHNNTALETSPYILDKIRQSSYHSVIGIWNNPLFEQKHSPSSSTVAPTAEIAIQTDPVSFSTGVSEASDISDPATVVQSSSPLELSSVVGDLFSSPNQNEFDCLDALESTIMPQTRSPEEVQHTQHTRDITKRAKAGERAAKKIAQSKDESAKSQAAKNKKAAEEARKAKQEEAKKETQNALQAIIAQMQSSSLTDSAELITEAKQLLRSGNQREIQDFIALTQSQIDCATEKKKKEAAERATFDSVTKPILTNLAEITFDELISEFEILRGGADELFADNGKGPRNESLYVARLQAIGKDIQYLIAATLTPSVARSKIKELNNAITIDITKSTRLHKAANTQLSEIIVSKMISAGEQDSEVNMIQMYLQDYNKLHALFIAKLREIQSTIHSRQQQ